MIEISQLKFRYPDGEFHLDIESLQISTGASAAIIGPSGTGKTTLLNLISGVAVPESGVVTTHGTEISVLDDRARRDFRIQNIGFIFQEFELLEYLDVLDNILLPYRTSAALTLTPAVRQRARELAQMVGIEDKLGRYVHHLSQGERQRVAICRALLPAPALILADEPTGNLDPENTDKVLDLIFDYVHSNGTTLISVTHERHLIDRFDQVVDFATFRKVDGHA